jgi:MFS family permease
MARFRKVLKNRSFFLLWLGQIISQLGDRLGQVALVALVYSRSPDSTLQLALAFIVIIFPVFIIGPVAGAYVDRWDRRQTMYICDLVRAALVLAIPFILKIQFGFPLTYLILFFVFCLGRFFLPAKLSIIPELVAKEDLVIANSLVNTTGMIATVLGFGISAMIINAWGPESGFYINALSFLVSAGCILFIKRKRHGHFDPSGLGLAIVRAIGKTIAQEIKEGISYFFRLPDIRSTAGIFFMLAAGLGAFSVVSIRFLQQTFQSGTVWAKLCVPLGLGLLLGSIIYGKYCQRFSPYKIIFASLFGSGILLFVFIPIVRARPDLLIATAFSLGLGFLVAPIISLPNTIIHSVSDTAMMGKVFSSLEIVMHIGFFIFMVISSFLAAIFSPGIILMGVGFIFAIMGLICFLRSKKPWLD